VSGLTRRLAHVERGSERLKAASSARSARVSLGRADCRRKTANSWRSTRISSSFEPRCRPSSHTSANRFRTTRYASDQSNQPSLDHDKSAEPTELDAPESRGRVCEPYAPEQREAHDRIYGIERGALAGTGPMVVSVNGTIASIAVTEFIAYVSGLREPAAQLTYRGDLQVIRRSVDEPEPGCYFCRGTWGSALG
jgi:hypothetical protein